MICPNYADPQFLIYSAQVPPLLYYSSLPAVIVSLALGFFVFFKDRKNLLNRLLLSISIIFSFWIFSNLILWTNNNSTIIAFFWMLLGFLGPILVLASLYFIYVFISKKDAPFRLKLFLALVVLPLVLFSYQNIKEFNLTICGGIEDVGSFYYYYYYGFISLITLWILIFSIFRYRKAEKEFRTQIILITAGIELFLFSFFTASFLASYLVDKGIIKDFGLENYGLFGMTFFMGVLAYLIVKHKMFNIKMLAAEALVAGLVILLFSEFFFIGIEDVTVTILISITILLATIFGIWLINSIRNEVKRKEELQSMSNSLAMANDKLTKLDNAKSEFISIASHQLRTPLTAVKGFVSMMLEGSYGKLDPKQMDVLNKVYTSNERLIHLVEDLLDISRMESGRMEFKLAKTKIEDICQEVVDTFIIRAKESNLKLEYNPPKTPMPELMIDGIKIREVVSNLTDNAIKYTPKGGVVLRVEHGEFSIFNSQFSNNLQESNDQKPISDGGGVVRVIISDTGIGVPKTELPYLFSKFSRGKDVSRLNTGGTGLGLYVGKGIVEANGGKIWAESDGEGLGSRFIIELPVEQSKELMDRWG